MSPLSWPVVTGTLLVGSPAIYAAQVAGTLSVDAAMVRLLLCAVGVWMVCSMFASFSAQALEANRARQTAIEKAEREKAAAKAAAEAKADAASAATESAA